MLETMVDDDPRRAPPSFSLTPTLLVALLFGLE